MEHHGRVVLTRSLNRCRFIHYRVQTRRAMELYRSSRISARPKAGIRLVSHKSSSRLPWQCQYYFLPDRGYLFTFKFQSVTAVGRHQFILLDGHIHACLYGRCMRDSETTGDWTCKLSSLISLSPYAHCTTSALRLSHTVPNSQYLTLILSNSSLISMNKAPKAFKKSVASTDTVNHKVCRPTS